MAAYDNDLTGYDEHLHHDESTHEGYIREAYGDSCPGCGTLRYGGDCFMCADRDEAAAVAFEAREAAMKDGGF